MTSSLSVNGISGEASRIRYKEMITTRLLARAAVDAALQLY
jgi:hypothetical protein